MQKNYEPAALTRHALEARKQLVVAAAIEEAAQFIRTRGMAQLSQRLVMFNV